LVVACTSLMVIVFFEQLFSLIIILLTTIIQPLPNYYPTITQLLMCLFYFIVVGWLFKSGNQFSVECHTKANANKNRFTLYFFSYYLRYVCPVLLTVIFVHVAFWSCKRISRN
jgi:NSS family neurotransmitter:Na+ symporter